MLYKILLFVGVGLNVLAQFLLKTGMKQIGLVEINSKIFNRLLTMLLNPYFIGGIFFYGMGFIIYSIVLSKVDLGKAYPVASASAIILIFLLSVVFFSETIDLVKIIGVILCISGIFFIFR